MSLDLLNSWATLLSNLGVIAGLIFLGIQIRQSNRLIDVENRALTIGSVFPIAEKLIDDPSLIELMIKDRDQLTDIERARLDMLGRRVIQGIRQAYIGSDELEAQIMTYRSMYHRKINFGMPNVWPEYKAVLPKDFVKWFEENIVEWQER